MSLPFLKANVKPAVQATPAIGSAPGQRDGPLGTFNFALASALSTSVAAAVLLGTGYRLWQDIEANSHLLALWSSLAAYAGAFAIAWYGSLRSVSPQRRENAAVAAVLAAFLLYATNFLLYKLTAYGTDAILFNTYSAEVVMHGGNPYTQSMQPAFSFFDAPRSLVTPTVTGQAVFAQSYPALGFLIYVPFAFLGINAVWASVLAHAALILILAWVAPRPLKALAPLVLFIDPSYTSYSLGSVTDILWAVPIVLCAYVWRSQPTKAAIYLGIACCIKQAPWFVVPFALVDWALGAREQRDWNRFFVPFAALLLAFLIPNLPFAFLDFSAWSHGILRPMAGDLIAFGSGLVQLTTANVSGLGGQRVYSALSLSVLLFLLVLYGFRRRALGFLPFIAPAIVLFFAWRSLQNYFMFWPVALIAYNFSPRQPLAEAKPQRFGKVYAAALVAAAAVIVVGIFIGRNALGSAQALQLDIVSYGYDENTNNIDSVVLRVVNAGPGNVEARFATFTQGTGVDFNFWKTVPISIPAKKESLVRLHAPNLESEIKPSGQSLQIVSLDALTGYSVYSAPKEILPLATGMANPRLAAWSAGPPSTPVGWDFSLPDFTSHRVARIRDGNRSVLAFDVRPAKENEWNLAAVSQTVSGALHPFAVELRPFTDYQGSAFPLSVFGVELVDALGHHAYVTINSSLLHREVYQRDRFAVFVYPGVLGQWNSIKVDPEDLTHFAGFMLSPQSQIRFNVLGACHRRETVPARGDFGGFSNG